jgi:AAA15 family ATPase/GTPase
MITEIALSNFRGFDNHVIPLRPLTIIVGKNSAGKSTIVEALRLISAITRGSRVSVTVNFRLGWTDRGASAAFFHPQKNLASPGTH